MDCSTPGFPVHHQLLELTQTHVHWVGDAIQPSHPLSSPSPPAFNLFQHQVFSSESVLRIRWPKYWSFSVSISPSKEYSAGRAPLVILAPLPHKKAGIPLEDASQEVVLLSTQGHLPKLWGPPGSPCEGDDFGLRHQMMRNCWHRPEVQPAPPGDGWWVSKWNLIESPCIMHLYGSKFQFASH